MNGFLQIDSTELWHVGGWTMVHFLWLGMLAGVIAAALRFMLRRAGPNTRYVAALTSLVLLAALPFAIAAWLLQSSLVETQNGINIALRSFESVEKNANNFDIEVAGQLAAGASPAAPIPFDGSNAEAEFDAEAGQLNPRGNRGLTGGFESPTFQQAVTWLGSHVSWLPWLWLVGTPITLTLLATGIVGSERLRRSGRPVIDGPIAELGAKLAKSLRVSRRVTIAACERVAAPVLVGILRPVILLPPAALTGWSPDEIEMVLLHELAHVRRWDNLVNLLQRLIESLLFFHPAVWLVSRWVRSEREACCDAFVVRRTSRPHAYAELLVALAAQMPRSVLFQPAATSAMVAAPLRKRIRRILHLEDDPMLISGKSFTVMLAAFLTAIALVVFYMPTHGQAEDDTTNSTESAAENEANKQNAKDDSAETPDESDKEQATTDAQRVLATFPPDIMHSPTEFFGAVDDARKRNANIDLETSEKEWKLVVALATTEKDWPGVLGEAPRKERVIADKAYQRLGLKLVPAATLESIEFQTRGTAGPIKIVGGSVPEHLPLPAYLRQIGNNPPLQSFDDLLAWLNGDGQQLPHAVRVYAWANGHEYLFEAEPLDSPKEASVTETQAAPATPFPTLEEQKLADLAYRQLQLELEPINDEELQRVKALGYEGGVRVAQAVGGSEGRFYPGDILVGLHVWPTTNMKAVAEVLNRDDVAELNPLKFYVVRRNAPDGNDFVQGGRISVNSDSPFASQQSARPQEAPTVDSMSSNPTTTEPAPWVPSYELPSAADEAARAKPPTGSGGNLTVQNYREAMRQSQAARTSPANNSESRTADGPSKSDERQRTSRSSVVSPAEIEALREHIKILEEQFERLDALYKTGSRGGSASNRALAGYELARSKAELALAEGQRRDSATYFQQAKSYAEEALKAFSAEYEAHNVTYDVLLQAARNLSDIKRRIAQLQNKSVASAPATAANNALAAQPSAAQVNVTTTPVSSFAHESIGVLRKIVEREKQKYERMAELAENKAVSATEVEAQRAEYEISRERLKQAERALEYYKVAVELAKADYAAAAEARELTTRAVSDLELRKLQLRVQSAEAQLKAMSE